MKLFKIIISIIFLFILPVNNLYANNEKASIAVFVLQENENINGVKVSVISNLNNLGFLSKDGNFYLNKISKILNLNSIVENSEFLSEATDADLFVIVKVKQKTINSNSIKVFMSSDIFNTQTRNFITSWSTPIKIINYSSDCDLICKNVLISQAVILLGDQLGKSIGRLLDLSSVSSSNFKNIAKTYNFKSSNISQNDIIYITDLMVNEFPGYIKLSNQESYGDQNMWTYYSTSEVRKLKKWLIIALGERNLKLEKDYELTISDNNFFIKKFPKFNSLGSKGNPNKFN